jgi:hypothetical protein
MQRSKKAWSVVAIALTFAGFGIAMAQDAPAPTPPVEIDARREVNLTPPEMLTTARGYLPAMDKGAAVVKQQLAEARKQRDVVKTLCLNDKLQQINLAITTANDRVNGLASAVSQNDTDRSKHEFTVIQVLRDRVNTLVTEAQQCIGEETGFIGDSLVTVEIDPSIADTDPSDFPDDPLIAEPPVLISPTL